MFSAYYVPKFPVSYITQDGVDRWVHMPDHPRSRYRILDAILEHIDNTNYIEPIRITIPAEGQVQAGPAGVCRMYALRHIRGYTHVPVIVSTQKYYDWFGEDVVKLTDKEQIRSYFRLEPMAYGFDENGRAYWINQNPNEKQIRETFKVSPETLERTLKGFELL
tara:strand:+ start:142 stop:633 length:492 start_codon:yes stop_codon:yes gene_type:complete